MGAPPGLAGPGRGVGMAAPGMMPMHPPAPGAIRGPAPGRGPPMMTHPGPGGMRPPAPPMAPPPQGMRPPPPMQNPPQ